MLQRFLKLGLMLAFLSLSACGFHLRGEMPLAKPLHSLYIQSIDPYGVLVKELEQSLKMSHVTLTANPNDADTTLVITRDDTAQTLLSVGGTQQTRQYQLSVTVTFEIVDATGRVIIAPQSIAEARVITIQSSQILGSSNEASLYFQQMRRQLASAIMYRLASRQVTNAINQAYGIKKPAPKHSRARKKVTKHEA